MENDPLRFLDGPNLWDRIATPETPAKEQAEVRRSATACSGAGWSVRIRTSMDEIRRVSKDYDQTRENWERQEMMGKAAQAGGKSAGYMSAVEILAEALSDESESDCEKCHIGLAIKWDDGVMECPHCTHRWSLPNSELSQPRPE